MDAQDAGRPWARILLAAVLVIAAVVPWLGRAAPALVSFSNGSVASATAVNANFSALNTALAARTRWTPLDRVSVGSLPDATASATFNLPAQVPADATEVLFYVSVLTGNIATNTAREFQFHVVDEVDAAKKYSHYLYVYGYPQGAVSYTSDNFWMPVTADRKLYVNRILGPTFGNNFGGSISVVGYR